MTKPTLPPLPDFDGVDPTVGAAVYLNAYVKEGLPLDTSGMPPELDDVGRARYEAAISATQEGHVPFSVGNFRINPSRDFYDKQYLAELDAQIAVQSPAAEKAPSIPFSQRLQAVLAQFKQAFKSEAPAAAPPKAEKRRAPAKTVFPTKAAKVPKPAPTPTSSVSVSADANTRLKIQSQLQQGEANGRSQKI